MDNRATVKVEFSIYNRDFTCNMNINWSLNDDVDRRLSDWFRECRDEARAEFEAMNDAAIAKERAAAVEWQERAELARLKAKYEPPVAEAGK